MAPSVAHVRLDHASSAPPVWREPGQFSITRVQSTCGLGSHIRKWSCVPAALVSVTLRPLARDNYRLWIDGRLMETPPVEAWRSNVVDFESDPACWSGLPFDFMHFHLPRASINEVAEDLGYDRPGVFQVSILAADTVLARITERVRHSLGCAGAPTLLSLDHLQLVLGAHILRRYGGVRRRRTPATIGLTDWQARRVRELLRDSLRADVRLHEIARECELPTSTFARAFRSSFGTDCHTWWRRNKLGLAGPRGTDAAMLH